MPRAEIDGEMGEAQVGLQARLMSQALRKLTAVVAKSSTCLIFINQLREKIGVMFGNPETTTGGRALKFYSSVRVDIRRIGAIKDGDQVVGSRTRVKVVKNKVAPPFRIAEFDLMYGEGVSREGDLLDLAVANRLVEKSGTWFSYDGERLGQGRERVKQFLKENTAVFESIDARLRKTLNLAAAKQSGSEARGSRPKSPRREVAPSGSHEADGLFLGRLMTPVEWMQIIVSGAAALAALVGIAAALVAVFWRGATFTEAITKSVVESERRLRAENQEAHAAIGRSIERLGDRLGAKLDGLATDVAVLRGRQEERDRS